MSVLSHHKDLLPQPNTPVANAKPARQKKRLAMFVILP